MDEDGAMRRTLLALAALIGCALTATGAAAAAPSWTAPPAGAPFDYQLGGDYPPAPAVRVVSRDWFSGRPAGGGRYSICYVNAFQTQADEPGVNRPDERSNWPSDLVLSALGDDPNWGGEYLVDIRSPATRRRAVAWLAPMIGRCAAKGFQAVEFDNLDSWTRFDGTPLAGKVPFGRAEAVAFAALITRRAHAKGLAVAQKNTPQLGRRTSLRTVGFDFAVSEQCGRYRECGAYTRVFGRRVFDIEYEDAGARRACAAIGRTASVVIRDIDLSPPGATGHRYEVCP
jgi:hypothetical protein